MGDYKKDFTDVNFSGYQSLENNPYINNGNNQGMSRNQQYNFDRGYGNQGFGNGYNQGSFQQYTNQNYSRFSNNQTSSLFGSNWENGNFAKGALIGAAATFLLTNETAQKAIFKVFAKASSMLQMGAEELKERYEDVKAELEAEKGE